jgi:uncharacterized protein YndB with AHSA1/START domain
MTLENYNISDDAVETATGMGWDGWIALLDEAGADKMTHQEIAALLTDKGHMESFWWAQTVTVGYEYAKGRRVKGQTADAGFQLGVQKSLPIEAERLWQLLTSPAGLAIWLGTGLQNLELEVGEKYETAEGATGEIRSVYPAEKLRLTWQPADWDNSSTLQLYLLAKDDKTSLRFHHEKLTGLPQRQEMKTHWQGVLSQLQKLVK